MRNSFDTGTHQGKHRKTCAVCGRDYYESLIGSCPAREKEKVCMYCCRSCGNSYKGDMGQGCREKDRRRAEKRKRAG